MFYWLENMSKQMAPHLVKYAMDAMENNFSELCYAVELRMPVWYLKCW